MSENQDNQPKVIDSYDGDPEDVIFFQPPQAEHTTYDPLTEEESQNLPSSEDGVEEESQNLPSSENGVEEESQNPPVPASEEEVIYENPITERLTGVIDINDPHYVNYKADPYYEYGYGPEPQPKYVKNESKKSNLGVASMITGISSMLSICCCSGISLVLGITGIITGAMGIRASKPGDSERTLSIIGLICAIIGALIQLGELLLQVVTVMGPYILTS